MSLGVAVPGNSAIYSSSEADLQWGNHPFPQNIVKSALIDSTATDSGNTPTTSLRPGLIMGELDSGAGWVDYDPTANDGSQQAKGILLEEVNLLNLFTAAAEDKLYRICISGPIKGGNCINLDYQARGQMKAQGFLFDDDLWSNFLPFSRRHTVTADTTVTAAMNGYLFVVSGSSGAVTFTLPTKAIGLRYRFLQMDAQNMVISSASSSDDIIADGDIAADTVTYSTSSHLKGSYCEIQCIEVGSTLYWLHSNLGGTTASIA